jgi:hypothetical protein
MDSMEFPVRIMAFEALIALAQSYGDIDKALLWVERAKNESAAHNVADAAWCLHEITLRLVQGNDQAVNDTIRYLITHYRNDEAVMQSLQQLFIQLGLFNPDGTPSAALLRMQADKQTEEPKIWTPDGGASAGSAAASKLWMPD